MTYVQRLKDQFIQNWRARCILNIKLNYYVNYKIDFTIEKYVSVVDVNKYRKQLAMFRSSNHNLMVENADDMTLIVNFAIAHFVKT